MTDPGSPNQTKKNLALSEAGPGIVSAVAHRHSSAPRIALSAADYLLKALGTDDFSEKREFAEMGLARFEATDDDDDELKALLLRQLYMVALESDELDEAYDIALAMVDLEELGDIARQDAARAALALELFDEALAHIEVAAKVCPDNRKSFHLSHLGALLRFAGRLDQSAEAFAAAYRWATKDRALIRAQQALVELQSGLAQESLGECLRELEAEKEKPAYALWILGELHFQLGDYESAAVYLSRFLERHEQSSRAKTLSLQGEIAYARALLEQIS